MSYCLLKFIFHSVLLLLEEKKSIIKIMSFINVLMCSTEKMCSSFNSRYLATAIMREIFCLFYFFPSKLALRLVEIPRETTLTKSNEMR